MLQSIRDNSQGIIAKVIVGLIIVTFALFGVESLVSLTNGSNAPATVNGEEITEQELYQEVELQRRQILSQMGENADPALLQDDLISQAVLENLIEQKVLVQSATEQGMVISEQLIDQILVSTRDFQVDGRFDRAQFNSVLRSAGLTPLSYRSLLSRDQLISQERFGYQLSSFVLNNEVDSLLALDRQTRDISYFVIPAAPVRADVQISDEAIAEAYEARKASLMTDEQVIVDYLLLERGDMAQDVTISNDELQSQYQAMISNFEAEQERRVSHILIELSEQQSDDQAMAKAQKLADRLAAGEDFAELARTESDDIGSSEQGGDLGFNDKSVFEGPFADALFELNDVGDVSAPVRTEFGYHLIKLTGVQKAEVPSFAEAEEKLREDLVADKVNEIFVDRFKELEDISFSSGDLIEPSEVLGLKIQTSEAFGRNGLSELFSNRHVVEAAFSEEVLEEGVNSAVIELDSDRALVLNVKQHLAPRVKSLDEVEDQLRAELVNSEAAKQLQAKADESVAALNGGTDMISASGTFELVVSSAVDRAATSVPAEIRTEAFRMPAPVDGANYTTVELFDGSFAVVELSKVAAGSAEIADEERAAMTRILANRGGQTDYRAMIETAKASAEIERL